MFAWQLATSGTFVRLPLLRFAKYSILNKFLGTAKKIASTSLDLSLFSHYRRFTQLYMDSAMSRHYFSWHNFARCILMWRSCLDRLFVATWKMALFLGGFVWNTPVLEFDAACHPQLRIARVCNRSRFMRHWAIAIASQTCPLVCATGFVES
jgi:hypothetical protein